MLIVACQKCGEVKVIAGSPGQGGLARVIWTCGKCGAGQIVELSISKDARRGDLRKIIGGLALAQDTSKHTIPSAIQDDMELGADDPDNIVGEDSW